MRKIAKLCFLGFSIVILGFMLVNVCVTSNLSVPSYREKFQNFSAKNQLRSASNPDAFISVWDTSKVEWGEDDIDQVKLPLEMNGTYDFFVDWGDDTNDTITVWNQYESIHTYSSPGNYTIKINGTIIGWRFNNAGHKLKIIEIVQWGCLHLGNSGGYFYNCRNLQISATDGLNLTGTTNMNYAFAYCVSLGSGDYLNHWNFSGVTHMSWIFAYSSPFNQPIGNWNVGNVVDMSVMLAGTSYNQPLGDWNVSKVKNMQGMFAGCAFNQNISDWDVSSVTTMQGMFGWESPFNQPIGAWDVSRVTNMKAMFYETPLFNQTIGMWNVSAVIDMEVMFCGATSFNQPIGNWNVSNVRYMESIFNHASSFNQPIGNWDITHVYSMSAMFFGASSFNQPLDDWNVTKVRDMRLMFQDAYAFNQPLGSWNVSKVSHMDDMFKNVRLNEENYDNLLIGWSQLDLIPGVVFHGGFSKAGSKEAKEARRYIIHTFGWKIRDGDLIHAIPGFDVGIILGVMGAVGLCILKRYYIQKKIKKRLDN